MTTRTGTFTTCSRIALAVFSTLLAGGLLYADAAMAKGKPGPGPSVTSDPVLAYIDRKLRLNVSNDNGDANTVLPTPTTPRVPFWSPAGDGSPDHPYHIFYSWCTTITEIDIEIKNNAATVIDPPHTFSYQDIDHPLPITLDQCVRNSLAFSPSGDYLYFGTYTAGTNQTSGLYRLPIDTVTGKRTDNSELVTTIGGSGGYDVPWLDVSPNGNKDRIYCL